jgi:hypothetical protein
VQFSEFFGSQHTVMAWVMPTFTFNSYGPIFAENGSGTYVVGQGDFGDGNGVDPVLFVQVGTKKAYYNAPTYKKREWNHIAVVRRQFFGGSYDFELYVNGRRVQPIGEDITFTTSTISGGPSGNLRIGRRTSGTTGSKGSWQYYGLIDDVAVFSEALTASEIEAAMTNPWSRSTLLAGWTFNTYDTLRWQLLDPKLKRPTTRQAPAYSVLVAGSRTASDASLFDGWLYVAPLQRSYALPFRSGEIWKVTQGVDVQPKTERDSHFGSAAFCYDLSKIDNPGNALVVASAAGDIIHVEDNRDPEPPNPREPNNVKIQTAPRELISYLHMKKGSYTSIFLDGVSQTEPQNGGEIMPIAADEPLARVGLAAEHVHFGARDALDGGMTIPLAFTDYEVASSPNGPWTHVVRGMPRTGQFVRRHD